MTFGVFFSRFFLSAQKFPAYSLGSFTFSFYLCSRSLNHAEAQRVEASGMRTYI